MTEYEWRQLELQIDFQLDTKRDQLRGRAASLSFACATVFIVGVFVHPSALPWMILLASAIGVIATALYLKAGRVAR